jgi:hypothetical protein
MAQATQPPAITDWGVPDPRNAGAYPEAISSTPMTQWGWEFLRRDSDYRRAWKKLVWPFLNGHGGFDEATVERDREETRIRASQERCGYQWQAPWRALHAEFGVSGDSDLCNVTLDPRLVLPPLFDGTYIKEVTRHNDWVKPPKVLLEFDVQRPLDLQLENARKVLTRRRDWLLGKPGGRKLQIDKFPIYLRLLDFHDTHTPDKEIGAHLFRNYSGEALRDRIRTTFKAARRWQADYLIVALHSPNAS